MNCFKKVFMKKKKTINILTNFPISHKRDIKTLFKQFINYCPKNTR